ncbi:MAG: hypothetical protein LBH11_02820 [Propionibacteriaceae bacterium]|jgi:hypothetical protein|nr:hypothetical protein [Propionibacteriaceae bacterium]
MPDEMNMAQNAENMMRDTQGRDGSQIDAPPGEGTGSSAAIKGKRLPVLATALTFAVILGGGFVANRLYTPPEVSTSERRLLATMPDLSWDALSEGSFTADFEKFAADSFIAREALRTLKAWTVFYPFAETDKAGLYLGDSGAGRFQRLDVASARRVAEKITRVVGGYLDGLNIYWGFVPDKSVYAGRYLPGFDPAAATAVMTPVLGDEGYIDLGDVLSAAAFYRTDLHWNQPWLRPVVERLSERMGFEMSWPGSTPPVSGTAQLPPSIGDFQGVYPGQLALSVPDDQLQYLPLPAQITAQYFDVSTLTWVDGPIYDEAEFASADPYSFFLRGPQALIRIDNPDAPTDRELFLFRDSFGSSLAPLLATSYARVTLIDLRYIDIRLVPEYVEFTPGSDALFLYSSQILNSHSVLLVP